MLDPVPDGTRNPEYQRRMQVAMQHGFQTREAELDLAGMLGDLAAE